MTNVVSNIFGSKDQELVAVPILPWLARNAGTGTITLPVGYTWSDFEYVEWVMGVGASHLAYDQAYIPKEQLRERTGWQSITNYVSENSSRYGVVVTGTSSNTATWATGEFSGGHPLVMKGYLKRYASTNNSAIIQLTPQNTTGGTFTADGEVQTNQRYELDIASVLGADWVGAQGLEVITEVYNDTGTGVADWGSVEWIFGEGVGSRGVAGAVLGDKIIVQTGTSSLSLEASYNGTPFGNTTTIHTALCRIRVNKGDQIATRLVGNGGAGKTVLYDGVLVGAGGTITLLDSMNNYDDIRLIGTVDTVTSTVTAEPIDIIGKNLWLDFTTSSNYVNTGNTTTDTSIGVSAVGVGNGIYKVIGINYQ